MSVDNVTETVVRVGVGLKPTSGSGAWMINSWPGLAAVVAISCVLVLLVVSAVICKLTMLCNHEQTDEIDALNDDTKVIVVHPRSHQSSVSEGSICRWVSEDNPYNQRKASLAYDLQSCEEETESSYYKRLLRTSMSE